MATTAKKITGKPKKRTMHLDNPGKAKTMCGLSGPKFDQGQDVRKVTCKTCRKAYDKDPKAFRAAVRKSKLTLVK